MNNVGILTDNACFEHHTPFPHCESIKRLKGIIDEIKTGKRLKTDNFYFSQATLANEFYAYLAHSKEYVDYVIRQIEGILTDEIIRLKNHVDIDDGGTFLSMGSLHAITKTHNTIIKAIDLVQSGEINDGFCITRPPGHHASKDFGNGFCVFNNVAVAARYLQSIGYQKIMIVDFDLHHGNGTQDIFYEDDSVYFFSTSIENKFPRTGSEEEVGVGAGEGYNRNIILGDYCSNKRIKGIYKNDLRESMAFFKPDFLLVSAGFDLHQNDFLSNTKIDDNGIITMLEAIIEESSDIPSLFVLEGGYNIGVLRRNVVNTLNLLLQK